VENQALHAHSIV